MQYGARPLRSTRRLSNLADGVQLRHWYSITNKAAADTGPTQISIYDEIGFYGVSAGDFLAELKGISGDIIVNISSPGGDVFDGIAIYNQLKQRKAKVHVIIDGLAASAASFIAQAASPGLLEIAPHAQMMIHDGFAMGIGNASDLRTLADQLDTVSDEIAGIYADRTGKPVAYWRELMRDETWLTDKQAVDVGLADRIHGQDETKPSAAWDLSVFAKFANLAPVVNADGDAPACKTCSGKGRLPHPATGKPGKVCPSCHGNGKYPAPGADDDSDSDEADDGTANQLTGVQRVRNADEPADLGNGWVQDADGTVRFDPDGDGDDDSTAEGDTDHDYFDADGNQVQEIPPRPEASNAAKDDDDEKDKNPDGSKKPFPGAAPPFKKKGAHLTAFPILDADVDNSPWDASKAWSAGAKADDPAAFYRGVCAGRKAGDPSTQAAWALPYRYTPDSPPNAAGVRNALSRLPQTKGLTNEAEARSTLEKALKAINPDDPDGPDDHLDAALLAQVFSLGLEGSRK